MRAVCASRHPRRLAAGERRAGRHPAPAPRPPRPRPARPSAPGRQGGRRGQEERGRRGRRGRRGLRAARHGSPAGARRAPPARLGGRGARRAHASRSRHAPAPAPASCSEQAVGVFNASEFPRRIAGVARSLGVPEVSVWSAEHSPAWSASSSRGSSAGTATRSTSARRPSRLACTARAPSLPSCGDGERLANALADARRRTLALGARLSRRPLRNPAPGSNIPHMIYCVVPRELADTCTPSSSSTTRARRTCG